MASDLGLHCSMALGGFTGSWCCVKTNGSPNHDFIMTKLIIETYANSTCSEQPLLIHSFVRACPVRCVNSCIEQVLNSLLWIHVGWVGEFLGI